MMNYLFGLGLYWMFFFMLIIILLFAFWLWMFIEALKKRDILWIVILFVSLFTMFGWFFALLYYFLEYEKKREPKVRRKAA